MKKGADSSFHVFEHGRSDLFCRPPFYKVSGLAYCSLKFVENLMQLCVFIKDILIVDDYYKTQSNLFR